MSEIISVRPTDLLIDNENPRISEEGLGQREAMRAVAQDQNGKLLVLAADIVSYGRLNPADLPIIVPSSDTPDHYVVREGNRRLTALRALENPDSFDGALSSAVLDQLRKLSVKYQSAPIETIQCCLMKDAEEAQHWVDLRHTGPNGGAGIVEWGPHEKARFQARTHGQVKIHMRLLEFLENGGHLTAAERRQVPLSSFERLVKSPAVRQRIGVSMDKDGRLHFQNEDTAVKGLLYIARDLISGTKKVVDIYTAGQRTD